MYLIYIDESGKPDMKDSDSPIFVLTALIINEEDWVDVNKKVIELKKRWFPEKPSEEIELHAADILHGKNEFRRLTLENRLSLLREIYEIIGDSRIVLISSVIIKDNLHKKDLDVEGWALRLLYERLNHFLEKSNEHAKKELRKIEYGLLLMDSIEKKYDRKVREKMIKYLKDGTYYVRSTEYIIEDVLFVSSHFRNLSQLADHAAFCVRRKYAPSNNWKDEVFEDFFRIIEKKFYAGERENPESYGLKIFPKNPN